MAATTTVLRNAKLATMVPGSSPYGLIERGAVVVSKGKIAWIGSESELPESYAGAACRDLAGRLVTPALVDCHTHLV